MPQIDAVFVLSSWHSGSTWVGYVLGSTPKSAFLGEYFRAWNEQARVPCTLCAMHGLSECAVLHDIEKLPAEQAFAIAAERTGKPVLVDNSKSIDWTKRFLRRHDLRCRVVHVVKDPRGWVASARRRHGADNLEQALTSWCKENQTMRDFVRAFGDRGVTVCYDLLAEHPHREFRRLFRFCGLPFSEQALRYWQTKHHAFAANGASHAIIEANSKGSAPGHFATGDDAYYERHSQRQFHDLRWRESLTADEEATIRSHPEVTTLMSSMGYRLTQAGVVMLSRWDWLRQLRFAAPRGGWRPPCGRHNPDLPVL